MWLTILSDQLPVIALVGRYPTNKLIGRGLLPERLTAFPQRAYAVLAAVSSGYPPPQGRYPRVTHPCASLHHPEGWLPLRLACVRPAASVRSEPGSNSQVNLTKNTQAETQMPNAKKTNRLLKHIDITSEHRKIPPPSPQTASQTKIPPCPKRIRVCAKDPAPPGQTAARVSLPNLKTTMSKSGHSDTARLGRLSHRAVSL